MTNLDQRVFVAGHRGMVGAALARELDRRGYRNVITRGRQELDLENQNQVHRFFSTTPVDVVYLAAAKVGGILANQNHPVDFLYRNLMIQSNVIRAAYAAGVRKLLFLGSSCIYPREAPQPLRGRAADGPAGIDQRALRHRQDRRPEAVRGLPAATRRALHLRHADQPVWPARQLRPAQQPCAAGADPQVPRRPRGRTGQRDDLGHRRAAARVRFTSTTWRAPASC